jgi:hypothetical protein
VIILAIVAAVCAAVVALAWATVARLQRRAQLRQGARLDRAAYAIDSTGRAYEAVPVEPCGGCGQTLPADHQCTGREMASA